MPNNCIVDGLNWIEQKIRGSKPDNISNLFLSILKLFLIIFVSITIIFYGYHLGHWLFEEESGIVVQPFDTIGMGEKNLSGEAISSLLSEDLYWINQVWKSNPISTKVNESMINEEAGPSPDVHEQGTLGQSISGLGTIGMGGTSFSIGNLIFSMKELSGKDKKSIITGSLQNYDSSISIVANLEDHHSPKNDIMVWEISSKGNRTIVEQIPTLIRALAFQIYYGTIKQWAQSEKHYPKTWQEFEFLTLGLDAYNKYNTNRNIRDLDEARNMTLQAGYDAGYNASSQLLSALGFAYLNAKNYSKAEYIFRKMTYVDPFNSTLGLGLVRANQGKFASAIIKFNEAIKINNKSTLAWDNEGWVLDNLGYYNKSIQAYNESIRINSTKAYPWNGEGWVLYEQGMNDKAIDCFNNSIHINKYYINAWNNEGWVLDNLGRHDRAIKVYEQAIKVEPANSNLWNNEGLALNGSGRYEEAIQAYDRAIELDSRNVLAWNNEGLALKALGNNTGADAAFAEVKKLVGLNSSPRIIDHAMASKINHKLSLAINRTNFVNANDTGVYSWLKLDKIIKAYNVTWEWYSPDGKSYNNYSVEISKPSGALFGSTPFCYLYLKGHKPAHQPGNWYVDIYIDGKKILTEQFTLSASRADSLVPSVLGD